MLAGFALACISPPLGTPMSGWFGRDLAHGCEAIHDDLFVRAAYLEQDGEAALFLGYDLLFVGRPMTDRIKGAIGRELGLPARCIVVNASHNHAGPTLGDYGLGVFEPPAPRYLDEVVEASLKAASEARRGRVEVSVEAGRGHTRLPVNRRRRDEQGEFQNAPNPGGLVDDSLPVALFRDRDGRPVVCLFAVACHPTIVQGFAISAEWPGAAARSLDAHFGRPCAVFLQGCGGDAKPRVQMEGDRWIQGDWSHVEQAGRMVADEVVQLVDGGLAPVTGRLRSAMVEAPWALGEPLDRAGYAALLTSDDPRSRRSDALQLWASRQVDRLDRGLPLPTAIPLTVQAIRLGDGLRLVALEGEICAPLGLQVAEFCGAGVTFALGDSNGVGIYVVTSEQMREGGYEPNSYAEYGWPAKPTGGYEPVLAEALDQLRARDAL